jgi:hypothetical protein
MGALLYLSLGLLAVLGRIVGQILGARWTLRGSRRELRTSTLVDAWRRLARAKGLPSADLRRALNDIQLVGTPAQVELAAIAARSLNEPAGEAPSVQELLEALRAEVRAEMGLGRPQTPLAFQRMVVDRDIGFGHAATGRRQFAHDLRRGGTSARLTVRGKAAPLRIAQGQR